MKQATAATLFCAGALAAALLWWWTGAPERVLPATATPGAATAPRPNAATTTATSGLDAPGGFAARTAEPDPLLTAGLRDALEALLLDAGDAPDPQALKQRLQALVERHFDAALATRALALAERYVDYRVALGELEPPPDPTDPRALRAAVAARDALRRQYFDETEYAALFADQESLGRYTLARLEIERNPDLGAAERSAALQGAQAELTPAQRSERAHSVVQVEVAAETARYNAQGTSAQARHAERSARYGEDAARRLAQLDDEEQRWNARLDDYARAQAAQAGPAQLAQLRAQHFTPEEQLRLDAALQLRQQAQ